MNLEINATTLVDETADSVSSLRSQAVAFSYPEAEPVWQVEELSQTMQRLRKKLLHQVGQAIADFDMIPPDATVLVCLSGGKDSYVLLHALMSLQARAKQAFKLIAMNLDQKQPGFPAHVLPRYLAKLGIEYRIVTQDTYSIVRSKIPEEKTSCSLCSRLRRGIIYRTAREVGATHIALGHHRDDIVETLFLNLFFGGKLKGMPPKYLTDDEAHIVIRPLAYCKERQIARFANAMRFPLIPCSLCGSQPNAQRQEIKRMLNEWDRQFPGRIESIFTAMTQVTRSHLADRELFDFINLKPKPSAT